MYQRRSAWLAEQKDKPCADCAQSYPACVMDFHHREGKTKEVSQMWSYSMERLEAEVALCDVVCANCHRIRHAATEAV